MEADLERARGLQQQGDVDRAAAIYQQILAEQPDHPEARHLLAVADIQRQDPVSAIDRLEALVADVPGDARYQNNLGNAYLQIGDQAAAVAAFDKAAELAPENVDFRANAATAHVALGEGDRAERDFKAALELEPDHFHSLHNLGSLLAKRGRPTEALSYLERAAAHPACLDETRVSLATVYERLNRLNDAERAMAQVGETERPPAVMMRARLRRRRGDAAGALALLDGLPRGASGFADAGAQGEWLHEVGLNADLTGDYERAFDCLTQAKARWRQDDEGRDGQAYIDNVRACRKQRWQVGPGATESGGPPIAFFVGFPRSGTTLLEVILDAHPRIHATGEDDFLDGVVEQTLAAGGAVKDTAVASVQNAYFDAFAARFGAVPAGTTVLDKMPLNLVHVRMIDAFFPQARLLLALRDPRDVVLSCLMQYFTRNPAMRCFDTLDEAVTLYEEVMGLWLEARDELSVPWLEYRYEDLLADQEGVIGQVLDFLGLPWDAAIEQYRDKAAQQEISTPSYRDVVEPLHQRGVGRWRNYRAELAPVLPRLEPFVRAFGYASDDG